jgi:superfamily II DNA or RNA helicase
MPTGSGKTKTTIKIIEDQLNINKMIIVLTPQREIFYQWLYELSYSHLSPGTIDTAGVRPGRGKVYVCMPLSLCNLLKYLPAAFRPDIIITDEAHHSAADSWRKIYKKWPKALRLGLTATPKRADGKGLDDLYDEIVQTVDPHHLIESGNLAKPLLIVPEKYLEKIEIKNGDFDPEEQARKLGKIKIIGDVIKKYNQVFAGLPVLVACSNHSHAEKMTKAFQAAGWEWDHIHSKLTSSARALLLRKISNGRLNGLCTVGIGTEGLDIPGLYGLIFLRRTMSLTIYLQFIGRVLRPLPGKTHGIIIDPVGNSFIHGLPEAPRHWSLNGDIINEKEACQKMKLCSFCGTMNSVNNTDCHFCGCSLAANYSKKSRIPAIVDGELVCINGEIPRMRREEIKIEKSKDDSFFKKPVNIALRDREKFKRAIKRFL